MATRSSQITDFSKILESFKVSGSAQPFPSAEYFDA